MLVSNVVTVTPEMAREFLGHNIKTNRRKSKETINRYARIMRAGGWNLTHQGIAFDTEGSLIDGQHRLEAIIAANVPVQMMVTYNVEHRDGEAFTIDVGKKRTTRNIIQMSGIEDDVYAYMSGYVAAYMRMKAGYRNQPEAAETIAYIDRHHDDLAKALDIIGRANGGGRDRMSVRVPLVLGVAVISALYRGESTEALWQFIRTFRYNNLDGVDRYNTKCALNLREYIRVHKPGQETLRYAENSIWSFAHNLTRVYPDVDRYPYIAALDA